MQHFHVKSTRKTAAGMFRAGRVYAVDPQDRARLKALTAMVSAEAAAKVTAAQAEKLGLQVIALEAPEAEGETDQGTAEKAAAKGAGK